MGGKGLEALSPAQNAVIGMSAGLVEIFSLQPLLYCKNATQQKLPLTLSPAVLYRGVAMSAVNMSIITGVQFPLTGAIAKGISGGSRPLTDSEKLGAAFTGGVVSAFLCSPMELVMIQQQRFGGSLLSTPARIAASHGAGTFLRGLLPTMGREGLFTMGYLALGPVVSKRITEMTGVTGPAATLGGCSLAGIFAATLSHPLDTIKTCVQGDIERKTYRGLGHTTRTLLQESGPARFFSGWSWRTGRMICALFIIGGVKDTLAPRLFPEAFAESDVE